MFVVVDGKDIGFGGFLNDYDDDDDDEDEDNDDGIEDAASRR